MKFEKIICIQLNSPKKAFLAGAKRAALYVGWSQARHGVALNTKLSVTSSFLELQSPDFALKFVCTKF